MNMISYDMKSIFQKKKKILPHVLIIISLIFTFLFCEIILRIKHKIIINYDIEMWKYAKELKIRVKNQNINHVHQKNKVGIFQKVEIKTNQYGQRDIDYDNNYLNKFDKSYLIIGNSIPLGWGVQQEKIFSSLLNLKAKENKKNWVFVNGGIGNYNSLRYVNNYLENWKDLRFTHIIISYFVTDAEILENKKSNILIEHTHTGVVLWKLYKSLNTSLKVENISDYYRKIYDDNNLGFIVAKEELKKLVNYCNIKKIKCIIVNIPDIHKLNPYQLNFINKKIEKFSNQLKIEYIDLLPFFQNQDEKIFWNKFKDPHPNEYAHQIIANKIFEKLK